MIKEEEAERRKAKNVQRVAQSLDVGELLNEDSEYYASNRDIEEDANLTDAQKQLLLEIREKFKPDDIVADLCILYEVTKYKDESAEPDFWSQYQEFAEANMVDQLVRKDKLNKGDAQKLGEINAQRRNATRIDPEAQRELIQRAI